MTSGARRRRIAALAFGAALGAASAWAAPPARIALDVPIVRQERERCGPAALEMVLRSYGADSAAAHDSAAAAYDPALRGALITDLAAVAHRTGHEAEIGTLDLDGLVALLVAGVPPIVLLQAGRTPLTTPHYVVVTGWDAARGAFTLHDGGARPRVMNRSELGRRWSRAGSQALVVRRTP